MANIPLGVCVCMYTSHLFFLVHDSCGILVPQPKMEPVSPTQENAVLTTQPPEKSLHHIFIYIHWLMDT